MYEKPTGEIGIETPDDAAVINEYIVISSSHDLKQPRPNRLPEIRLKTPREFMGGGALGIKSALERARDGITTQDEAEMARAQGILDEMASKKTVPEIAKPIIDRMARVAKAGKKVLVAAAISEF